jgi:hypothetical protein
MFRKDTFSPVHAVGGRPKIYGRKSAVPASIDGAALLPQQCRQTSRKTSIAKSKDSSKSADAEAELDISLMTKLRTRLRSIRVRSGHVVEPALRKRLFEQAAHGHKSFHPFWTFDHRASECRS